MTRKRQWLVDECVGTVLRHPRRLGACDLPLSLLHKWWHDLPHSNKHADVFELMPR